MCVDVSKETFHNLVALILQNESVLLQKQPTAAAAGGAYEAGGVGQPELDATVVLSAINILTNHMFQLTRGSTPAVVRGGGVDGNSDETLRSCCL